MQRSTLDQILQQSESFAAADPNRFEVLEGHRVALHLGRPGRGLQVAEVKFCRLQEAFLEITSGDDGTVFFVEYGDVHALSCRPPKAASGRRTGFA